MKGKEPISECHDTNYHFLAMKLREIKIARGQQILPRENDMVICWDRPATCQKRQFDLTKSFSKKGGPADQSGSFDNG